MQRRAFIRLTVTVMGATAVGQLLQACGGTAPTGDAADLAEHTSQGPSVDQAGPVDLATGYPTNEPDLAHQTVTADLASPSSPPDLSSASSCTAGAKATSITGNHGHSLLVPGADFIAPVARSYSIMGASGHDHAISLSAANFTTLANGQPVTVASTSGAGHTHTVTLACA